MRFDGLNKQFIERKPLEKLRRQMLFAWSQNSKASRIDAISMRVIDSRHGLQVGSDG